MTIAITVHRGTQQIGGSCIELETTRGERLLLDAGRPLDAAQDAIGLLPITLDRDRPAAVVFSHPHMDHWGLIPELPIEWPLWTGTKSADLMRLTIGLFGGVLDRPINTWTSRTRKVQIGPFTITPYLTDHSAVDAYMLLIEAEGTRVLYTGDYRAHGRKAKLVEQMIANPPANIDVLLTEGTNLGTNKPVVTEAQLEEEFVELAAKISRHVFVQWSAQNLDRTVTLFRAARRSGRPLVIDLYAADVLERIGSGTGLPVPGRPEFPELKVLILGSGKRLYRRQGRNDFVQRVASNTCATSRARIRNTPAIIMLRDSMLREFAAGDLGFTGGDAYVFSNWSGYLKPDDPGSGWAHAVRAGAHVSRIHTSGHASPATIARFAAAMSPKWIVPIHGTAWDEPGIEVAGLIRLSDGERWLIGHNRAN